MICIVNYGSGNTKAIANIFENLRVEAEIVDSPAQLEKATKIILPGVGAFDDSMSRLNDSGLRKVLDQKVLDSRVPVLGICVGMQMMACSSEEGSLPGLSWFENSRVVKFDDMTIPQKPKLPHMGWNSVRSLQENSIFNQVDQNKGFYFLHSYRLTCPPENQLAVTHYGVEFVSAIRKNHIYGFQFHPEKSHSNGVSLFRNFAELQ